MTAFVTSICKARLRCDGCGQEEEFEGVADGTYARAQRQAMDAARAAGWKFRYPRCWCRACPMDAEVYCTIIGE